MTEIIVAVLVATHARHALAQPVVETESAWGSEPDRRGTMGILLPCLITLGLCVWTAVHLNINSQPTYGRLLVFKLTWLFLGMVAPEVVLWCAYDQFMEARAIQKVILEIQRDRLQLKKPHFSMRSAFFVLMGGYAVHPAPGKFHGLPVTLTAQGFVILYAQGDINPEDLGTRVIEDKSKADGLAKLVVCIQALWLVVQGIGRLASRLPLPLLELHTIMHVLCAVGIYGLWWRKAMDIRYPVVLPLKEELAARIYFSFDGARVGDTAMCVRNNRAQESQAPDAPSDHEIVGNHPEDATSDAPSDAPPDLENQTHAPRTEDSKLASTDTRSCEGVQKTVKAAWSHVMSLVRHLSNVDSAQYPERLDDNHFLPRLNFIKDQSRGHILPIVWCFVNWNDSFRLWPAPSGELKATEARLRRFCRDDSPFALDLGDIVLGKEGTQCNPLCVRARMTVRKSSVRSNNVLYNSSLSLMAFSMVYGGAHAAAWNTHLPTEVELLLWRISSVALAAGIPLGICFGWLYVKITVYIESCASRKLMNMIDIATFCFFLSLILFVLLARGFLVVEAFISLRSLKKGSFDVVPWSNYWPHF